MDPAQTGRTPHTLRRNLIIFTISIVASGWVGIAIDKLTGQPDYQDVATLNGGGTLGMGVWTVAPLLVVIALRTFCGDGWKNAGYALNVRGNGWLYTLSIAVYPATTCVVILLGTQVGAMHVAALNMSAILAHALEDAVTLALLIDGTITLDPRWALVFSTNTGLLPAVILLSVGLGIRRWRIKNQAKANGYH